MKTIATKISTTNGLSFVERTARIVIGATLIGTAFFSGDNTLGGLALLPLLGIYPLYSGLTGTAMHSLFENNSAVFRVTHAAASVALIGSVFVVGAAPLGIVAVLPLLGIYAALCALLGRSPLATVVDANKAVPYIMPPVAEAIAVSDTSTRRTAIPRAA
jgi:hypothetical protein